MKNKISEKIGICIASQEGIILSQNEMCSSLCSIKAGSICHFLITHSHLDPEIQHTNKNAEGMFFKKCHNLENSLVDIATINDGSTLTTMIYPLKDHIEKQIEFFKQFELSKRELEVANLMLNGRTNEAIAKGLFISKATLKTHINSIYKKVPTKYIHILKDR